MAVVPGLCSMPYFIRRGAARGVGDMHEQRGCSWDGLMEFGTCWHIAQRRAVTERDLQRLPRRD
jgi:hypothetical protein